MAEPKIVESKQNRLPKKAVKIDGMTWYYIEPGMGTQSRLSQHMSRAKLFGKRAATLDIKIDNDTITEEELDKYEEYLDKAKEHTEKLIEIFSNTYRDGSDDNASVKKWLDETPPWKIEKAFKDIPQGNKNAGEETTEPETPAKA